MLSDAEKKFQRLHRVRKNKALLMLEVKSDSRKGVKHKIMLGQDNIVFCTCESWEYGFRTDFECKHLQRMRVALKETTRKR